MLEKDIKKVLVSHDEIVEAAKKLGETLTKEYQGKNPIFVGILKGSVPSVSYTHLDVYKRQSLKIGFLNRLLSTSSKKKERKDSD